MSHDYKMGVFISVAFPLWLGIVIGLLVFLPPSEFVLWWKNIEWEAQGVANVGAWVAGIGTTFAAIATGFAARSSSKAAIAAEKSTNQWQKRASYEQYIDTGVKARIKLRWLEAHLSHMFDRKFDVFMESDKQTKESFYLCLQPDFIHTNIDAYNRFEKYKDEILHQSEKINGLKKDLFDLIEVSFELSKNHIGIHSSEKKEIRRIIEKFIVDIEFISRLYERVFNSNCNSKDRLLIDIDSCFNCSDSKRHFYLSIKSNLSLISAFFDTLIIDSNVLAWEKAKNENILAEKTIFKSITNGKCSVLEPVLKSMDSKFERL